MLIINPIPGQEEENAEFLESHHVGVWLKKDMNISETISSLINDDDKLGQMKLHTHDISNRYSTRDICEILIKNKEAK